MPCVKECVALIVISVDFSAKLGKFDPFTASLLRCSVSALAAGGFGRLTSQPECTAVAGNLNNAAIRVFFYKKLVPDTSQAFFPKQSGRMIKYFGCFAEDGE